MGTKIQKMKKIIQQYNKCIGCGTCVALCPEFWEMDDNGKARPRRGVKNSETGDYEFELDQDSFGCNKDAVEACPVAVIHIR
jgi:ferredoxin